MASSSSTGSNRGGLFFGSTDQAGARHAARLASAASGTGKVLSDLQVELANARGALETTKNQLRISQRAVEHLSRQVGDLSDGKERLKLENEGLSKMLARKERLLDETVARARASEAQQDGNRKAVLEHGKRAKELEAAYALAEERMYKAESEYNALRKSFGSITSGFRSELSDLRTIILGMEQKYATDLAEAKAKHQASASLAYLPF